MKLRLVFALILTALFHAATAGTPAAEGQTAGTDDPHAAHRAMMQQKTYARRQAEYTIPPLSLVNRHGESLELSEVLNSDQPVMMQFIFTSCTTICPVLSATFAASRGKLNDLGPEYRLVSISIDPEYDTPERLQDYAERFGAGDNWYFLTGTEADIYRVRQAFNADYGGNNKMYHQPYTYIRTHESQDWLRLDGMLSARELVEEYRTLLTADQTVGNTVGAQ